ncbi:MAG: hypothetical protein JSW39_17400 [Desulfobacterales bacterium]|nr:MAG: hypothetical protein JSW39_17400 [Desulfobacterales bacterium]
MGLAVAVGGVAINPGDILVGDRDGVVVVPRLQAAATAANLQAIRAKEKQMEAEVKAGRTQPAWLAAALKTRGVRDVG